MEIDHIVICIEAPELMAQILKDFGLTEGEPNSHIGQGTANKRFFFDDFFIELLYINDEDALKSAATAPTQLYERFTNETGDASPFGVIFRPGNNKFSPQNHASTAYNPRYLPPSLTMTIFEVPTTDPLYLYYDFLTPASRANYITTRHEIGFKAATSIKIFQPDIASKLQQDIQANDIITFENNDTHLLEITFDDGLSQDTHDFRPELPLIFKW